MNKSEAFRKLKEDYEPIAEVEAKTNRFAKVVCRLLDETYLIQQREGDADDYRAAASFLDAIRDYLALLDIELCVDEERHIIYVVSAADHNRYRLSKLETVTLLVLRSLTFLKAKDSIFNEEIYVTTQEIEDKIRETGIYPNYYGKTELRSALTTLRHYKIVDYDCPDPSLSDSKIQIYSSIFIVVNGGTLDELKDRLAKYVGGTDDEKTDPDQAD